MVALLDIMIPILPLMVASIVCPLIKRFSSFRSIIHTVSVIASFCFALSLSLILKPGTIFMKSLWRGETYTASILIDRIQLAVIYVDTLSTIFIVICLLVCMFASMYSFNVIGEKDVPELYYPLLCTLGMGLYFIFISGDLISLIASWELMSISTYGLIFIKRTCPLSLEAGVKYLVMSAIASGLIVYATSIVYGATGRFDFLGISNALTQENLRVLHLATAFFIAGFGFKAAAVPFHAWAPDVYQEALNPISAVLSGAASKAGIYAIMRVMFTFLPLEGTSLALALVAAATMTLGNIVALLQTDLKRLMAYSSIAHIGYILAGIASGNLIGVAGAIFHAINHAIMKPLAFLCAGNFEYITGRRDFEGLGGVGRLVELEGLNMSLGILALIGIPGFNGFISKYLIIMGTIDANLIWLAILVIANSAIAVAYYIRVLQTIFRTPIIELESVKRISLTMSAPVMVMAALCLIIGVYPTPIMEICLNASKYLLVISGGP